MRIYPHLKFSFKIQLLSFVFIFLAVNGDTPLFERVASAQSLDNLTPNRWHFVDPKWEYLTNGRYQNRGWCSFAPTKEGKLLFWEGFYNQTLGSSIYANALYSYDALANTISMLSLNNWAFDDETWKTVPLSENATTPTPVNRHTYNQFCYVPENQSVYLIEGANQTAPNGHPKDFWRFSLKENRWIQLPFGNPLPDTPDWACPCENNLLYDPERHELIYFWSPAKVYVFDLKNEKWAARMPTGNAGIIGAKGIYDPKRKRFLFYGSNWVADDSQQSDDFVAFYPASNKWENIQLSDPNPGPRSYVPLAYIPKYDVVILHGGYYKNDTWVYRPSYNKWALFQSDGDLPLTNMNLYFDYDAKNDVLIRYHDGKIWLMRYQDQEILSGVNDNEVKPEDFAIKAYPNPSMSGARLNIYSKRAVTIHIAIYNLQGNEIKRVTLPAASSSFEWDGLDQNFRPAPSGIYFIRAWQGSQYASSRIVIIR